MKRFWFLVIAVLVGASTYDYGRTAGHYGLVVVGGLVAVFLLVDKVIG